MVVDLGDALIVVAACLIVRERADGAIVADCS